MRPDARLLLPSDVLVMPATAFTPALRRRMGATNSDWVVSRPCWRTRSLVIDAEAAAFLERLRSPVTVVDAILAHADHSDHDPETLLTDAVPLLLRLKQQQLIAVEGEPEALPLDPSLLPGSTIGNTSVERCIHLYEDVEVYLAHDPAGEAVAVKILRPNAGQRQRQLIRREEAILRHLDGRPAPRLLCSGERDGRLFLVLQWMDGIDAVRTARTRRIEGGAAIPAGILDLCQHLLRAYSILHGRGVIHGDVHPSNILVGHSGQVCLLDFGYACCDHATQGLPPARRGGRPEYLEPEYCAALLRGEPMPQATKASDQYGLAALLHLLLCGRPYLGQPLDRDAWLHKVVTGGPISFADNSFPPWPAMEALLSQALHVDPTRRFPSIDALLQSFSSVITPHRRTLPATAPGEALRTRVYSRLSQGRGLDQDKKFHLASPPRVSVNYGAAGIAWYLYRVAGLRDEPDLLSAADLWLTNALRCSADPAAFEDQDTGITLASTGPLSPFHRMSGLHLVNAHLCLARGDLAVATRIADAYAASCDIPCDNPDLTLGWTSALLGCAALTEALHHTAACTHPPVLALGRRLAGAVEGWLDQGPVNTARTPNWLGLAHGWAGLLFGLLRWAEATGTAPSSVVRSRLEELAALAVQSNGQLSWPILLDDERHGHRSVTGWCHGNAGYVLLWTLAHRLLGQDRFLDLAQQAAHTIRAQYASDQATNGSLCCGYAGQGFALLALYRATGDQAALQTAKTLAELAVGLATDHAHPNSLYKGKVGIALLLEELRFPDHSCMPLVESEGWRRPYS